MGRWLRRNDPALLRVGVASSQPLVVFRQVHAGVEASYLVCVAVEEDGGLVVGKGTGVNAALAFLGETVAGVGIDIRVEAVLRRFNLVPEGARLLVRKDDLDDGFGRLVAPLPSTLMRTGAPFWLGRTSP